MTLLTMTLVAMLLSTVSARTLTYGPPSYYVYSCTDLWICAPNELVGDKKLTINIANIKHGDQYADIDQTDHGWCVIFAQTWYGPDVVIDFFLDGDMVHTGHYQQNYCGMAAGAITTDDPNAEIQEGDFGTDGNGGPGYVFIKHW